MTKTEIGNLFGRNKTSAQITRALTALLSAGLARFVNEETEGRHAERWFPRERNLGYISRPRQTPPEVSNSFTESAPAVRYETQRSEEACSNEVLYNSLQECISR